MLRNPLRPGPAWARLVCLLLLACGTPAVRPETAWPAEDPLVDLAEYDERWIVAPTYATADNFTGQVLYDESRALLRRSAAERLARVQDRLDPQGLRLVVLDAYRPHHVQRRMWELVPDPQYVADPHRGSRHNRGMAVDVTLATRTGERLPMPTAHDEFTPHSAADAEVPFPHRRRNRDLLIDTMAAEGFAVLPSEWWHFDAPGWEDAPVLDVPVVDPPEAFQDRLADPAAHAPADVPR